ncbi:ABC transporter ATP-binding protein [Moraxella bovis]|uniref:ABC transporter ATP-binding protein n=1 Tax=Moraxella bovis TaxID=476 RepID=UPI002227942E|nr:ABC transporter ATP-binding protein [Moraxella bovis]UYZ69261.1 ABC transporter ATP-binding protein [Moraxella bovis]UYZ71635.1 ABC transporter ATP-binding protein [Moraxella bovis]UYZ72451.1 ABC transporter ATP-binding protein [Moraxella bovis]UZA14930.1 ABC transporter ATP-binding protein [Moraxella bovis]UZA26709.1 ABC transporter ATP-binding protein [Moraxella bovis]
MAELFTLQNLTIKTAQKTLLNIPNLVVPQGKLVSLIGANGAGKSTLLSALLGQTDSATLSGKILCQNRPIDSVIKEGQIALVGQHEYFELPLTTLEYALLGVAPQLAWYQQPNQNDTKKALALLSSFELDTFAHKRITSLSGGERQRLAIVRALMQDTQILLLDEPTNHLDIKHERALFVYLRNLVKQEQKSLVVVLHNLTYAYRYSDEIIALKAGELVAQGVPDMVMNETVLATLYDTPIKRYHTDDGVMIG